MPSCKSIYDPQEDSTMLEKWVRQRAEGKVLDVGTGSGIQAIAAALSSKVDSVLAVDIQKEVIDYCKKNIKNRKIIFIQSDLFQNIKGKFDTIIFNPPYLPQELKLKDLTIDGGKKGYEVIEGFLNDANNFLSADGIILMVFSSLTKKEKVDEFIKNNLLEFEELEKMRIFFEDLYAYSIKKSDFLKELERKEISNIHYFARGHRGLLFTGKYKNKKIAIKAKNPESKAIGRIENEAGWLKRLNKAKIGPKLVYSNNGYLVCEHIEGGLITDYLKKSNKNKIKIILRKIFSQLFTLDKLMIDKEEMHHPVKHIIVSKNIPVMIDFERAHYSQNPKNVTQFCQFLASGNLSKTLNEKGIFLGRKDIIRLAKVYKRNQTLNNLRSIMGLVCK